MLTTTYREVEKSHFCWNSLKNLVEIGDFSSKTIILRIFFYVNWHKLWLGPDKQPILLTGNRLRTAYLTILLKCYAIRKISKNRNAYFENVKMLFWNLWIGFHLDHASKIWPRISLAKNDHHDHEVTWCRWIERRFKFCDNSNTASKIIIFTNFNTRLNS